MAKRTWKTHKISVDPGLLALFVKLFDEDTAFYRIPELATWFIRAMQGALKTGRLWVELESPVLNELGYHVQNFLGEQNPLTPNEVAALKRYQEAWSSLLDRTGETDKLIEQEEEELEEDRRKDPEFYRFFSEPKWKRFTIAVDQTLYALLVAFAQSEMADYVDPDVLRGVIQQARKGQFTIKTRDLIELQGGFRAFFFQAAAVASNAVKAAANRYNEAWQKLLEESGEYEKFHRWLEANESPETKAAIEKLTDEIMEEGKRFVLPSLDKKKKGGLNGLWRRRYR